MQNKKTHKPPKNKLLKNNILNRRKNKPPLEGIGNHLICLNKILRYPFIKDKSIYCINSANVLELIDILKVFGYESLYDPETKLLEISLISKEVNYEEIRYNKYYRHGYISPLPKILELRKNFEMSDENIKNFHLDCIKKVLKCEISKIINYYIPDFGLLEKLIETLKEYQYSIIFEKNILTITL